VKRSLKLAVVLSLLLSGSRARAATPCSAIAVSACFPALTLAAPGGNPGIPRVIAWRSTNDDSGIAWGTTAQIADANVYLTGDPSNGLTLNIPSGGAAFDFNITSAKNVLAINSRGEDVFTPIASAASAGAAFYTFNGAADTSIHAGVALTGALFDFSPTLTFATGNIPGDQAAVSIKAPTLAFAGASTVTNAATLEIDQAPVAGTFATITNDYGIWVKAGGEDLTGGLTLESSAAPNAGTKAYINYISGNAALYFNVPSNNVFGFRDNGTEHGYIQPSGTTEIFGADSGTVQLASGIADGGTAKAVIAQAGTALATAGAEIFSIQNGLTEKFGFKWDSGLVFSTTIKPAAADYGISQDGSNLIFGAPTGKGFSFNVNGSSVATVSNAGTAVFNGSVGSSDTGFFPGNHANVFLSSTNASHTGMLANSNVADGASAIGTTINNSVTLSTTGAKLLSVQNNGTEKFFVAFNGNITSATGGNWDLTSSGGLRLMGQTAGTPNLEVRNVNSNASNIDGQVDVSHIAGGSGAPTSPTAGTGCGTSSAPTVNAGSSDSSGDIQVVCGSAGTAGNPYLTITFAHAYNTAPNCVIFPANAQTAGGVVASDEFVSTTTGTLVINCGTGGTCTTNASALRWKYVCQQ
jgi:hypothetical protein